MYEDGAFDIFSALVYTIATYKLITQLSNYQNMLAVIETGGKQYLVKTGDTLKVEKLPSEAGKSFVFDKVLLLAADDGSDAKIGTPYLAGVSIGASVEEHWRAKKIRVVKFKRKV